MRGKWQYVVVVSIFLYIGCGDDGKLEFPPPPPPPDPGIWANVECPEGEAMTAWQRLQDIFELARAAAQKQAQAKAHACATEHVVGRPEHRVKVFNAWNAAQLGDWVTCVSELTHANDGGGVTGG